MTSKLAIDNDGVSIHVEIDGPNNAVPVVFLHGVTSSGKTWEWLPEEVTRGRQIVRLDFRGHGRSGHAPGRYRLPDYGGDVVAVLHAVAKPAVLVGHSLGGVVGWWVAQNHPDLVAAALLEDPPLLRALGAQPEEVVRIREVFKGMLANVLSVRAAGLSDQQLAEQMGAASFGTRGTAAFRDIAMDDAVEAIAFGHNRLDPQVLEGAIDGSTLANIDVESPVKPPILILAADDAFGAAFSTQDAKRLAQTHPAVEVIRISGCGHGIHDERRHRETFVRRLSRLLDAYAPRNAQL